MRHLPLLLVLTATACGKQAAPPATTAPTEAPEPTSPPATTASSEPDVGAQTVEDAVAAPSEPETAAAPVEVRTPALETAARALVDAWLKAQNEASFDAYTTLYAPRFTGIKRSGEREKTYARAGWLADRQRMFKSAMRVSADQVKVELASGTAIVTFTQTWASGSYQDAGPKMLVLVPDNGGLTIAREEMLASELQGASGDAKAIDPAQFAFVIGVNEEAWVLVPTEDVDLGVLATGAPKLAQKLDPTVVVSALDGTKLDPKLASWLGRKVASGSCTATIDRLELVGRYTPHFGVVQGWNGTDGVEPIGKPLTDAEIAASAWASSGLDVVLAGHITGCAPSWVHSADQPERPSYATETTDAEGAKKAIAAFRALSGWKAIQAEAAASEPPVPSPWDAYESVAPTVQVWSDAAKTHTYVHVTASAGTGCGQFGGAFGALFERKADGDLVLISDPEGGPTETIVDVVDVDGDGDVEFVLDQGLVQRVGPIWKNTLDVTPPYYDCPC